MTVPALDNGSTATVELLPYFDVDGSFVSVVVIKQRFEWSSTGATDKTGGATVHLVDVPWENTDEVVSARYPSDGGLAKLGTDVVVVGSAAPPEGRANQVDVRVLVGPVAKRVTVYGPRVWYRATTGMALTPPEPFDGLDLRWEYAWGGSCAEDPASSVFEVRNPLGTGASSVPGNLNHQPGPRIEDPDHPIRTHRTAPPPAGVAAIGTNFEPRRSFAGTFDQAWEDERMPLLPEDFDYRHNQVATPDLICPDFLRGDEPVELINLHPEGPARFKLPKLRFFVGARSSRGGVEEFRANLDTVVLEPMNRVLDMTWRAVVPVGVPLHVRSIQVHEKRFS